MKKLVRLSKITIAVVWVISAIAIATITGGGVAGAVGIEPSCSIGVGTTAVQGFGPTGAGTYTVSWSPETYTMSCSNVAATQALEPYAIYASATADGVEMSIEVFDLCDGYAGTSTMHTYDNLTYSCTNSPGFIKSNFTTTGTISTAPVLGLGDGPCELVGTEPLCLRAIYVGAATCAVTFAASSCSGGGSGTLAAPGAATGYMDSVWESFEVSYSGCSTTSGDVIVSSCTAGGSNTMADPGSGSWYQLLDGSSVLVSTPAGETGAGPGPCTLLDLTGNVTSPVQVSGTTYPYTVSWTGGATAILAVDPNQESGSTETLDGKSFYKSSVVGNISGAPAAAQTGATGLVPGQTDLPVSFTGDQSLVFDFATVVGDAVDPQFWCDYEGEWFSFGSATSLQSGATSSPNPDQPGVPCTAGTSNNAIDCAGSGGSSGGQGSESDDGGAFPLSECFTSTGMTLDDPITWVTGAVSFAICGVKWLFEPASNDVTAITNQFGFSADGGSSGSCGATAPTDTSGSVTQWLGAGFTLITDGPSCSFNTMASEESAGETSTYLTSGDSYTANGHTYAVSLPAAITETTSSTPVAIYFTILLAILTAVMGVFFFFAIKAMITQILSKFG